MSTDAITVSLKSEHFSQSYVLRAYVGSRVVGRLDAVIQSESTILLGDLHVEAPIENDESHFFRAVRWLLPKQKPNSFRVRGIGSMMLQHFLNWCKETGISEVFGSVTQSDLEVSPWLLDWYRRYGFDVSSPDGRCLVNAVHMVVWKNDLTQLRG